MVAYETRRLGALENCPTCGDRNGATEFIDAFAVSLQRVWVAQFRTQLRLRSALGNHRHEQCHSEPMTAAVFEPPMLRQKHSPLLASIKAVATGVHWEG